jgi:AcrR family transcriptional regulator
VIETPRSASGKPTPEDTRERIVLAAREVIARKGKRGATTREIADLANVNEATLFRHFGNKEALLVAVAKHCCPDATLRDLLAQLNGPLEQDLYAIASAISSYLEQARDIIRWSLVETEYENSVFAEQAWRPQMAMRAVLSEYMTSRVQAGELRGDPNELGMMFMGMMVIRVIAREKFPDSRLFSDQEYGTQRFVNTFLNGVRSK